MKYLLAACALLIATNAFASKPDSGICPWKMPFGINIDGYGQTHSSVRHVVSGYIKSDTDYGYQFSGELFQITVDTMFGEYYSFVKDTLIFSESQIQPGPPYYHNKFILFKIVFAENKDSIISLSYSELDTGITLGGLGSWAYGKYDFQLSSALFDDTAIFFGDSSIITHNFSMAGTDTNSKFATSNDFETRYFQFSATSVTLSGLFRTTTFSDPSASVAAPIPNSLSIFNSNGSIACSFKGSEQERNLELYSPLGIREASVAIPPNESQASLPHLMSGIYFVRLEGDVRKIFIP